MDEFYEYWELIPEFEKFEEAGKEIVKYKRNIQDPDLTARDLPESVIEFFQYHLITQPYPIWEIIYHITDIRSHDKNRLLEELVLNALSTLIDLIGEGHFDKRDKLYNLLSNIYVSEWCIQRISDIIVPRLYELKEIQGLLDDVLYLALLSRSSLTLLKTYMNYERQQIIGDCRTKSFFLRTSHEKVHWINTLLDESHDDVTCTLEHRVYHHLKLFRLLLKMGQIEWGDNSWWRELEQVDWNVVESGSALELCVMELRRQRNVFQFLNKHCSLTERIVPGNLILDQLLSLQVDFSIQNYESIKSVLQTNYKLTFDRKKSEVSLLNQYMVMKLYFNIILISDSPQEILDSHLNSIRSLLRTIDDGKTLFQLLQNVFTLIFLRFEHIRKTKRKRKNSETRSSSHSNQNNSHTTDVSDTTAVDSLQSGFVCLKVSLKAILNSMRMFLMGIDQMTVYETCDDDLKQRFGVMLRNVDNALWRLRIIENEGVKKSKSHQSVKEWIQTDDARAIELQHEITSEDEKTPKKKVHRKKLKKRPKIAVNADENDEASDDPVEFYLVTDTSIDNSEARTPSRTTESQRKVKSVISKLLMSHESLITICMLKNDQEGIQKLIEEYNLQNSDIFNEISFINSYKESKFKLEQIVQLFNQLSLKQHQRSNSKCIDDIRNIAESGFEKAKFLNALEKFTTHNKLKQNQSDARLIDKASEQHSNLKMYQGDMINILPVIDFMISLSCPYDLNHHIYKHINKHWNLSDLEDGNFGYRKFLKNLVDILTVFKNHNMERSIADIMNDEIFTLEPNNLNRQLVNRRNVFEMLKLDIKKLDEESELQDMLHMFDSFEADGNFLTRIVCYVKSVRQLMKFQTNELFGVDEIMRQNLYNVIGRIIFQQQYSPEQVENFAFNVNVNLVHSMAVASVGEIARPSGGVDDEKLLSLFHMNEIGADAVKPDLQSNNEERELHIINNMDILFYIKRESFMLAYLMKEIQNVDYKSLVYDSPNFLDHLANLPIINTLMELFNSNRMMTALNYDHIDLRLILNKIQETPGLHQKLEILSSISERQWNRNRVQFNEIRDFYIEKLIAADPSKLEEIGCAKKFSALLLKCIGDVESDEEAERLIRWSLKEDIDGSHHEELEKWLKKLNIYQRVTKRFDTLEMTWRKIKRLAEDNPAVIVNYLVNINMDLVLCLEFLEMHPLKQRNDEIMKMWVEILNNKSLNDHHHLVFKIVDMFPLKNIIEYFDFSLGFISNLPSMIRVVEFLCSKLDSVPVLNRMRYHKFMLSSKIFEVLDDIGELWRLASRPLIILEQLLMNSKIQSLREVIKNLRTGLSENQSCSSCANTNKSMYRVGETLVYDFDAHHDGLMITNECLDLLLKLYAAKALDFEIVEVHSGQSSTEVSSLDSTYGIFQMPKDVPSKNHWISDDATNHCMCCRRQKFSLLTRRHHCRRCGRVVCSSCSQNRMKIESIYGNLQVRCCLDCFHQTIKKSESIAEDASKGKPSDIKEEWKLTGDISSDQIVRDEFNFEYSPNVGLCIAIINLHSANDELAKFLLFHCHRLELLLRPIRGKINPEVDLILVAKMLKCLAFAAKIRGADDEANVIIDHADMVLKVAELGCESIAPQIPLEPVTSVTIRSVINDLIKAENWKMALEMSVKWDRAGTPGVFSAWGVSAIKSGQYRFAREKIALALQPVNGSQTNVNDEFIKILNTSDPVDPKKFAFKRPARSAPLLHEVLESLEATASKTKALDSKPHSPVRFKESSKNVLNVMDSLRKIQEGDYGPSTRSPADKFKWQSTEILQSPYYEESMFYLLNYGGNLEFLTFLMRNKLVASALRYVVTMQVPPDLFIQVVFVPNIRMGLIQELIELIKQIDSSFMMWKQYIVSSCKYLERRRAYHCLYQMQTLTGDLVRASLTCIKFYLDGPGNYTELHEKAHHLVDAKMHLQAELERTEAEGSVKTENSNNEGIVLKWDPKAINAHINVISLQLEVARYLAKCETDKLPTIELMSQIFMDKPGLKTLFGKNQERTHVAILLLLCGHSIESGFGISYRIIQECSLTPMRIYSTSTKYLAKNLDRLLQVEKLVTSIRANAANEENVIDTDTLNDCDELVSMAVEIAYNQHQANAKSEIDQLIKLITSKKMKVHCYINSNQLKTAFMLCTSGSNLEEIRKIMKQAELTRQENIRRLCEKKLFRDDSVSQGSKSDINQM